MAEVTGALIRFRLLACLRFLPSFPYFTHHYICPGKNSYVGAISLFLTDILKPLNQAGVQQPAGL